MNATLSYMAGIVTGLLIMTGVALYANTGLSYRVAHIESRQTLLTDLLTQIPDVPEVTADTIHITPAYGLKKK